MARELWLVFGDDYALWVGLIFAAVLAWVLLREAGEPKR